MSSKIKTKSQSSTGKPKASVCLIVIDGWGVSEEVHGNAVANADTPVMDEFAKQGANGHYLTLDASGLSVGLPAGLMGNSEVGHLNIGAGRVIYQDIVRINLDCESKVKVGYFSICVYIFLLQGNPQERQLCGRLSARKDHLRRTIDAPWSGERRWRARPH